MDRVIVGAVAVALTGVALIVIADIKLRGEFMRECLLDHKRYECTAMWRAGNSHNQTVYVPVAVPR